MRSGLVVSAPSLLFFTCRRLRINHPRTLKKKMLVIAGLKVFYEYEREEFVNC